MVVEGEISTEKSGEGQHDSDHPSEVSQQPIQSVSTSPAIAIDAFRPSGGGAMLLESPGKELTGEEYPEANRTVSPSVAALGLEGPIDPEVVDDSPQAREEAMVPPELPYQSMQPLRHGPFPGQIFQPMDAYQQTHPQYFISPQFQAQSTQFYAPPPPLSQIGGRPPPTPSSASLDDGRPAYDMNVLGRVLSNFNVEEYADVRLHVTHETGRLNPTTFFLHKLVIGRSDTLRDLLTEYAGNYGDDHRILANLKIAGRFVTIASLESALRTCYGESVMNFPAPVEQGSSPRDAGISVTYMVESLAFIAAGFLLKLEDVVQRGVQAVNTRLDWDNIEHAISFGMECCNHRSESPDRNAIPSFSPQSLYLSDRSSEKVQNAVIAEYQMDQRAMLGNSRPPSSDPHHHESHRPRSPTYCAADLLSVCINFVADYCPANWIFIPSARSLPIVERLPIVISNQNAPTKSRLAKIRFGEQSPAPGVYTDDVDLLISSIVLSLPFQWLEPLLRRSKYIGSPIYHQTRQIVDERERRRLSVKESDSVDWNQRRLAKDTEWVEVGLREYVVWGPQGDEIQCMRTHIYRDDEDHALATKRDQAGRGFREK